MREAPSKRQRTEDEPTLSNDAPSVNPADITHVTDSMPNQTQPPVVHRPIKNKESNEKYQNEQPSVPQVPEGLEEIMTDAPNEITNNAMLPATAHVEPSASEPGAQQPAPALGNTIPEIQEVSAQTAPEDQTMGSPPRIVDGSQPAIDASNDGDIEMNDVGNDAGNDEIPPKPEDTVFIPWEADLKNIASQSQLEDLVIANQFHSNTAVC